ncbi:hypothetical protein EI94DRAFT_156161 [Lactarius quietus]|nr:hypothetical protein EI94DRAFT_156161 [Lactarius quietus]
MPPFTVADGYKMAPGDGQHIIPLILLIPTIASSLSTHSLSSLSSTLSAFGFDEDMTVPAHCVVSELWITYHQASRAQRPVTAQLVDVTDLLDLEDVLDHVFQQGFVDPKWRSVAWFEECTSTRLKACHAVQDLLARGVGSTPASALRLVIADTPTAVWVHYEYVHCTHHRTTTQRIRLDVAQMKSCERLAHITNYIFAQGYLPCKFRSLVSWKGPCGKHIEECARIEDVLSCGDGVCEEKPLRLVIDM